MMRLLVITLLWVVMANCQADYYVEYVWYRAEPEESRIVITWEHLRGSKAIDRFVQNKREHEAIGKFLAHDHGIEKKEFSKTEQIDGHSIQTTITIHPPLGHGLGGEAPNVDIKVYFDGVLKVDCPFGFMSDCWATISKVVVYTEHESARVSLQDDTEKISEDVWNFFDLGNEKIVFVGGKLLSCPEPIILKDGSPAKVQGRLVQEKFPGPPNYESVENGDVMELCWMVHIDAPVQAKGEDMETGKTFITKETLKLQLCMPRGPLAEYKELLGKQVKVSGEVFIGHNGHHRTPVLLDLTRNGSINPLGILPDE